MTQINEIDWTALGVTVEPDGSLTKGELSCHNPAQMLAALAIFYTTPTGRVLPGEDLALAQISFEGFDIPAHTFDEIIWKHEKLTEVRKIITEEKQSST